MMNLDRLNFFQLPTAWEGGGRGAEGKERENLYIYETAEP